MKIRCGGCGRMVGMWSGKAMATAVAAGALAGGMAGMLFTYWMFKAI